MPTTQFPKPNFHCQSGLVGQASQKRKMQSRSANQPYPKSALCFQNQRAFDTSQKRAIHVGNNPRINPKEFCFRRLVERFMDLMHD